MDGIQGEEGTRELLRLSVGLQKARAPGITDQLLQVVMQNYSSRTDDVSRLQFLKVACEDFGVHGKQSSTQYHSWTSESSDWGDVSN